MNALASRRGVYIFYTQHREMMRHLGVSSMAAFKIWKLSKPLQLTAFVLAAALVGALLWAWWSPPDYRPFASLFGWLAEQLTVSHLMLTALTILSGFILVSLLGAGAAQQIQRTVKWRETLGRIGVALGVGVLGWIFAQLHLRVFDRLFLRKGRVA